MADRNLDRTSGTTRPPISRAEWAVAFAGLALVVGAVGFLVAVGLTRDDSPPNLSVTVERVMPGRAGHRVELAVVNTGGSTAGEVRIEGTLTRGGTVAETAETTVQFVPRDSRRTAWLTFRHDPRAYELVITPTGYREP